MIMIKINKIEIILITSIIIVVSGCLSGISGNYYYTEDPRYYLSLYDNGEFTMFKPDGINEGGTYIVDGDTLILKFEPFNLALTGKINGNSIIDGGGKIYVKQ